MRTGSDRLGEQQTTADYAPLGARFRVFGLNTPTPEFRGILRETGPRSPIDRAQGSEAPLGDETSSEQSAKVDRAGRTFPKQSAKADHAGRTSPAQSAKGPRGLS